MLNHSSHTGFVCFTHSDDAQTQLSSMFADWFSLAAPLESRKRQNCFSINVKYNQLYAIKLETNIYPQYTTPVSIKLQKYPCIQKLLKYLEIINYRVTLRIVITSLSVILEITEISMHSKITKLLSMFKIIELPLLDNSDRSQLTTTRKVRLDISNHCEFNSGGGELRHATGARSSS